MIKNIQLADCFKTGGVRLERVKYFQRQLLTVDDMVTDQEYFRQKMRRHNRFLHGWGVVCGLDVTTAATQTTPWRVRIGEGYALGPYGDEIYVSEPVYFDLAKCGPNDRSDPCDPGNARGMRGSGGAVYLAIEYAECFSQPVSAMPAGCGCDDDGCEYSRIRDSFDICCLNELPPYDVPSPCDSKIPVPCPPCPTTSLVPLAKVTLTVNQMLIDTDIITSVRKTLYRTEILQKGLMDCCCKPAPVTVTVVPKDGTSFQTSNSPTQVVLTFSKPLQAGAVTPNSVLVTDGSGKLMGPPQYDPVSRTATIKPAKTPTFLPQTYKVTARGSGPNAITDLDGLTLVGNQLGGGVDYATTFSVSDPTTTPQ